MATGMIKENPFPEGGVREVCEHVAEFFGATSRECEVAEGQCFRLSLIAKMLRYLGDPDADYVESLSGGGAAGTGWVNATGTGDLRAKDKVVPGRPRGG